MLSRKNKTGMLRQFFSFSFFTAGIAFLFSTAAQAVATCYGEMRAGVCFPTGTGLSSRPVEFILVNFMWWILALVGMIAIIAFVISGIQYLVSAGDEDMIKTAKRNMTYSIVGVLVALSGWVIIRSIDYALNGGLLGTILGLLGF